MEKAWVGLSGKPEKGNLVFLVLVNVFIEWPLSNLRAALKYTGQSDWYI